MLFTHVIFEVGSGPAQQEDSCALGVAVLAGQVQSRVPRLGERQEKGGFRWPQAAAPGDWKKQTRGFHSLREGMKTEGLYFLCGGQGQVTRLVPGRAR